jgi:multidrug efflux system membrane fusion protein
MSRQARSFCRRSTRLLWILGCAAAAASCGEPEPPPGRDAATRGGGAAGGGGRRALQFPVEVRAVEARDVEYRISAVGSIEAFEIVQVTARVPGVVEAVLFAEGDRVERNATLVEIEPERYRLAVESARATLEKAAAARAEAQAGLDRREGATARQPGIIPAEEIETWRTRVRTAEADLLLARAALDQAELNRHDAYLRAPVAGTIQSRTVQTGAYVQPGTTLATLLRRDPLLLRFNVAESDAGRLHPGMTASFKVREMPRERAARIVHVAAAADPATRMVAVTAHVDVAGGDVPRPGAFAEVGVPVGAARGAPVIPETAVRPSERGFLAYVVQSGKASERVLQLGMRTADGLVEVRSGLAPGDSLVVRGAEALRDGATVRVVTPGSGDGAAPSTAAARP